MEQVAALIPEGREVIFLGDGEFDGCGLLAALEKQGWQFVCRTSRNAVLAEDGEIFSFADLAVAPGELLSVASVVFTGECLTGYDNIGRERFGFWSGNKSEFVGF